MTLSTKDWSTLPIEKWNVTTFHAYLIDRNKERYDVEYVPFGQGSISKRWAQEKGQIKQAINKYGTEVVRYYIEKCFINHRQNPKFPTLSFGFMYSYMRNELSVAELEVKRESQKTNNDAVITKIDESWF